MGGEGRGDREVPGASSVGNEDIWKCRRYYGWKWESGEEYRDLAKKKGSTEVGMRTTEASILLMWVWFSL